MTDTAQTYGASLFDLAVEEDKLHVYMEELSAIREAIASDPQILDLLDCRAVPIDQRLQVLDTCFRGKVQAYLLNFMKILCEKGAVRQLPACIRQFEVQYFDACGIVEAKAVTAKPLSPALQEKLQKKLEEITGKTIKLRCQVDPQILGGVRLDLMGKQMDGSIARRLDEMAKSLANLTL